MMLPHDQKIARQLLHRPQDLFGNRPRLDSTLAQWTGQPHDLPIDEFQTLLLESKQLGIPNQTRVRLIQRQDRQQMESGPQTLRGQLPGSLQEPTDIASQIDRHQIWS